MTEVTGIIVVTGIMEVTEMTEIGKIKQKFESDKRVGS